MVNRWSLAIGGLLVVVIALVVSISRIQPPAGGQQATPPAAKTILETPATTAEAVVVPVRRAQLAFQAGGRVATVAVEAGASVEAGQVLAELDTADLQLAVKGAEDAVALQEALLAQARAATRAEDIGAAEAEVAVAEAGVKSAQSSVAQAAANLAKVTAGPTERDLEVARQQIDLAKNQLYAAQGQRDALNAAKGSPSYVGAQGQVLSSEVQVRIAELRYADLQAGPRAEDVAAARAQLSQAQGQLDTARAQVTVAQARLAKVKAGFRAEDVAVAEAQVQQARTALEQARAQLAHSRLVAPFAGTIVTVVAREGELVAGGAPVLTLADLSRLRLETTDLEEASAATVRVGQPVGVVVNAFEAKTLAGKVAAVGYQGVLANTGETLYPVSIELDRQDPDLRWGMTAKVEFK